MNCFRVIMLLGLAALAGSCDAGYIAPNIYHEIPSPQKLRGLRRVVLIQFKDETGQPRVAEDLTDALAQALQECGLFRVDIISRNSSQLDGLPIDKLEPFTISELSKIAAQLRCDAVLIGRVKQFQPFPRMQISVLLRLIDLRDGQLVWGVDEKWNSTDLVVEKRIKWYFGNRMRSGYEPATWELVTRSPMQFCRFVAFEIGGTLPMGYGRGAPIADGRR